MKKSVLFAISISIISFVSCNGKANSEKDSSDRYEDRHAVVEEFNTAAHDTTNDDTEIIDEISIEQVK